MNITEDIAYPIIQRLTGTMNYNINIIDNDGVIIASTDWDRVNYIHEGAKEVLDSKQPLIIYKDDLGRFLGTKEGVNLPIEFMEEIIGVVGITGNPDELMQLAQMTKITVELMLQQDYLQKQAQFEQQLMDSWVMELIGPDEVDETKLLKHAKHFLQMDIEGEMTICLIESPKLKTSKGLEDLVKKNELKKEIFRYVQSVESDVNFFGVTNENLFIIGTALKSNHTELTVVENLYNSLLSKNRKMFSDCRISVGNRNTSIKGLRQSYFEARQSLDLMKNFKEDVATSHIKEWGLIRLLDQIPALIREEFLLQYRIDDLPPDLLETLQALLDCDHNLSQTAEKLHIHRNTLAYRLENIHQLLKLNPKSGKDLAMLYVLMILKKLNRSKEK
jgi:carbohydrate diacid regulator